MKLTVFLLFVAVIDILGVAELAFAADIPQSTGIRTVVLTGQTISGLLPDESTDDFANAVINDQGDVAFYSDFKGRPNSAHGVVVSDRTGALRLLSRYGAPAPTGPLVSVFSSHGSPYLSENGRVTYWAELDSAQIPNGSGWSLWTETDERVPLLLGVSNFTAAPGLDVSTRINFGSGTFTRVSPRGDIVIFAGLAGPGVTSANDSGAWVYRPSSAEFQFIGGSGRPFSGLPGNPILGVGDIQPVINDLGQIAVGVNFDGNTSLLLESTPGNFRTLLSNGTPIPGSANVIRQIGGDLVVTNAGDVMFRASMELPGGQLSARGHWFAAANGDIKQIVANGDHVPGFSNTTFGGIQNEPRLGPNRYAVFWADLRGDTFPPGSSNSVWLWHDGDLQLLARTGTQAADAPLGVLFNSFDTFSEPRIGTNGQTAFLATLRGSGVTNANDRGLWVSDATGELTLVAREGDRFEVAASDFRTIRAIQVVGRSSTEDGSASPFSSRGDLAFVLTFTDGTSGVFVTDAVAIPEPPSMALVGLAVLTIAVSSRRRAI